MNWILNSEFKIHSFWELSEFFLIIRIFCVTFPEDVWVLLY